MLRRALIAAACASATAATVIVPASQAGAATVTGKELLSILGASDFCAAGA